uniref:SCP domain-containing protein n=1 Tax=Cynoglossus semilaevis TaxID=244447 RepID=A0A3P8WPS9_CYNSE
MARLGKNVSFKREFLEAHNSYRKLHGAPPLALSSELNATAQKWADRLLALGLMNHSDTKDGENIYTVLKSEQLTGHFTQVVWKETTQLGVGVATVGTRSYVVAQYRPAGNMTMPGKFESNKYPIEFVFLSYNQFSIKSV